MSLKAEVYAWVTRLLREQGYRQQGRGPAKGFCAGIWPI